MSVFKVLAVRMSCQGQEGRRLSQGTLFKSFAQVPCVLIVAGYVGVLRSHMALCRASLLHPYTVTVELEQ